MYNKTSSYNRVNKDEVTLQQFYKSLSEDILERVTKIPDISQYRNIVRATVGEYVNIYFPSFRPLIKFRNIPNETDRIAFSFSLVSPNYSYLKKIV